MSSFVRKCRGRTFLLGNASRISFTARLGQRRDWVSGRPASDWVAAGCLRFNRQVGCFTFSTVGILATKTVSRRFTWFGPNRGGGGDARPQTLRGMPTPSFSVLPAQLGRGSRLYPVECGLHQVGSENTHSSSTSRLYSVTSSTLILFTVGQFCGILTWLSTGVAGAPIFLVI